MKIYYHLWRWCITTMCFVYVFIGGAFLSLTYFNYLKIRYKDNSKLIHIKAKKAIQVSFNIMLNISKFCRAYDVNFHNLEDLSKEGGLIIANHPTYIDYVILASKIPNLNCIVKESIANNFFLQNVVNTAGYIVNSRTEDKLSEIKEKISNGEKILIFPEGTRTDFNKDIKLKRGFAQLALRCQCSIMLFHIHCSENFLGKNCRWYHIYNNAPIFNIYFKKFISVNDLKSDYGDKEYSIGARHLTENIRSLILSYLK